jgi:serine/threonine protein kinase
VKVAAGGAAILLYYARVGVLPSTSGLQGGTPGTHAMAEMLKCSRGHKWERGLGQVGGDASEGRFANGEECPTCGEAAVEALHESTVVEGVAAAAGPALSDAEPAKRSAPVDAVPPAAPVDSAKPSIAGAMPFRIVRQHAQGGLGQISLAQDDAILREVALKQIQPLHADNPMLRKRFLYEARITGQLEHPSIVPVYCLGDDEEGRPYYVMRFVRGRTLDDIITEYWASPNAIVFRELLRRFIAVCQAVAYAHARGVIHRDLKPSNIMLGDYGETLVLDWGLAKDIKNRTDPLMFAAEGGAAGKARDSKAPPASSSPAANGHELTLEGQIIGTPAYMAPEQAAGRTELHAPVTDIYALGGILYKILTGKSPTAAKGSTGVPEGAVRTLTFVESPPPSKVVAGVDPILEAICRRGMATDPAARYPRALEMAQEIQRWLDEHPLTTGPTTFGSRLAGAIHRNFALMTVLLLLVCAACLVALLLRNHH